MKRKISIIKKHRSRIHKTVYLKYRKRKIKKDSFLVESTHGENFYGHMYEIVKGLNRLGYNENNISIAVRDTKKWKSNLQAHNIRCNVVEFLSKEYAQRLATCEYLFNDTTFYPFFNKRKDQKYYNIWHGTPLKHIGKHTGNPINIGNVQRNLYSADTLIFSNKYTAEKMIDAFNLDKVYQGKILETFSPRNIVFNSNETREKVRDKLKLSVDDKMIVYMPTWRDSYDGRKEFQNRLIEDLNFLEYNLKENEHFYIQLHPLQNNLLEKDMLEKVKVIPEDIPLYDFLSGSDTLITDYSSVMYDYINMNKQIIIYSFDKQDYYLTRGCYEDVSDYNFTEVKNIEQVLLSIRNKKNIDYSVEKRRFCKYDTFENNDITTLLKYLLEGKKYDNMREYSIKNDKETVAIFTGGFLDNGITSALLNMLEKIDPQKRNYLLFFNAKSVKKEHRFRLKNLPKGFTYYPISGGLEGTFLERFIVRRDALSENKIWNLFNPLLAKVYQREFDRMFGGLAIDHIIHYTGFERKTANLLKFVHKPKIKKYMWVHSDTFSDKKNRGRAMNLRLILEAQLASNKTVLVNEELRELYVDNQPKVSEKLDVVNNFLVDENLRKKSRESILETLFEAPVIKASNKLLNRVKSTYTPIENNHITSTLLFELLWNNKQKFIPNICHNISKYNEFYDRKLTELFLDSSGNNIVSNQHISVNIVQRLGYTKTMLLDDLNNPDIKVFINIGRFSKEKSHDRLIEAFSEINQKYPNTRLVIVGPHGPLKNETIKWAQDSGCDEDIYILGRMSNPYNLMKLCDAYVLSSLHEALGLVVYEALAVGTNVITVNIPETVKALSDDNAIIVDNSTEGIMQGLEKFIKNGSKEVSFNFNHWNKVANKQFESLFK